MFAGSFISPSQMCHFTWFRTAAAAGPGQETQKSSYHKSNSSRLSVHSVEPEPASGRPFERPAVVSALPSLALEFLTGFQSPRVFGAFPRPRSSAPAWIVGPRNPHSNSMMPKG